MKETKVDKAIRQTSTILTNKQTRSTVFLIITFLIILFLNSILPIIEGDSHYTVAAVEMPYAEYKAMKAESSHYRLTWVSETKIKLYIIDYINEHPEFTAEEKALIDAPDAFVVQVYTKFFYQHIFWYISTVTSMGSAILLFYSLFNFLITRAKDKYQDYIDLKGRVDSLSKDHLDPATFEPWLEDVFNRKRKIKQHVSNVKYDLKRLETKTKYPVRKRLQAYYKLERGSEESKQVFDSLGDLTKQERAYYQKKEQYLDLLEESYINEYVIDGDVAHFKYIHPTFVHSGVNIQGRSIDSYSLIKSDTSRLLGDALSKIVMSIATTVLFAVALTVTVIASYEQSAFWIVVNILAKIAPLFIQIPMAIDYTNVYMDAHLITVLNSRRSIGLLYLADMHKADSLKSSIDENTQKEITKEVQSYAETY